VRGHEGFPRPMQVYLRAVLVSGAAFQCFAVVGVGSLQVGSRPSYLVRSGVEGNSEE
jgi:hypothetical protein